MPYNFCAIFEKNNLYRGLALHASLQRHCPDFKLWILCMDDKSYEILKKLELQNIKLLYLAEFEDSELLAVKNTRSLEEYRWTCVASFMLFLLKKYPEIDFISYLESDIYFFSSPRPIFEEINANSIAIIPHRFAPNQKNLEETKGAYNTGWVSIKNDPEGLECLNLWRRQCLEWCYHYFENGKMSNQLYLNDWPQRFKNICVIKNKGSNAAPWNISQYNVRQAGDKIFIDNDRLIFYNFHSLKIFSDLQFQLSHKAYKISDQVKKFIYRPYLEEIKTAVKKAAVVDKNSHFGFFKKSSISLAGKIKYRLKKSVNQIFNKKTVREKEIKVKNSGFVRLQFFNDFPDGNLAIAEKGKSVDFDIKRVYFINNLFNKKARRGFHAHKTLEQIIFCINGYFTLMLDDGKTKQKILMNDPCYGVRLGPKLWHTMTKFSPDCVILVLTADCYKESDYLRDYDQFLKYIKQ